LSQYGRFPAPIELVKSDQFMRMFGGPFPTRDAASEAAQALPGWLKMKPIVVKR
jgi:hypothetical protein